MEGLSDAINMMLPADEGRKHIPLRHLIRKPVVKTDIKTVNEVVLKKYVIRELETGGVQWTLYSIEISATGIQSVNSYVYCSRNT